MISVRTIDEKRNYRPGEVIDAEVTWIDTTEDIGVALVWSTEGKGSRDEESVSSEMIRIGEQSSGKAKVSFTAPIGPYSFSGRLVSLIWHVVAGLRKAAYYAKTEIVIGPEGEELRLYRAFERKEHESS